PPARQRDLLLNVHVVTRQHMLDRTTIDFRIVGITPSEAAKQDRGALEPSGTCPGPAPDTSGTGFAASRLARQTRLRSRSYALRTATGSAGCAGGAGLKMATSVRQSLAIMSPSVSQSLQKGREFGASKWRDQPFGGARGFRPAYLSARRLSGA